MPTKQSIPWLRIGAESVAIVGSILLAFAIDAWYAGAIERQVAADYESRIGSELQGLREDLELVARTVDRALEYAQEAEAFFENEADGVDENRLIVALYNLGREYVDPFDLSTYQDLLSSGRLGLITDNEKRAAIQRAYELIPFMQSVRFPYVEEYTLRVLARIPQELGDQIRATEGCRNMAAEEWDCETADFTVADVALVLSRLSDESTYTGFRARVLGLTLLQGHTAFITGEIDKSIAYLRSDLGG